MNIFITIMLFIATIAALAGAVYASGKFMRMMSTRNERAMAHAFVKNLRESRSDCLQKRIDLFMKEFSVEKDAAEEIAEKLVKLEESLYAVFFRIFIKGEIQGLSDANKSVEKIINSCCTSMSDYVSATTGPSPEQMAEFQQAIDKHEKENVKLQVEIDQLKLEMDKIEQEKNELLKEAERTMAEYVAMYAEKQKSA